MSIIRWNGSDVPDELRRLPAGRYVVEPLDEAPALTAEEEQGLAAALASLRAGQAIDHDVVRARMAARFRS